MRLGLIAIGLLAFSCAAAGSSLADLAWMAGSWRAEWPGGSSEELWTDPDGGLMLGLNRSVREGKKTGFEFLRIEERNGAVVYLASPGGASPTAFELTEAKRNRAVFENPKHDFPQRIVYWKKDTNLCARVETLAGEGEEWCWERKGP